MAEVTLKNVRKIYPGGYCAVKDVNIEIRDKEFMILVGPSGCGKSTTLRMIAGLESVSSGDLIIDGRRVNDVPSMDRDIAMVFQNYALYPHMTIYDNMAFSLLMRNYPKPEIKRRVEEAAEILELTPVLLRKPKALSGGQRQRVAVGRAIVRKPKVFLFDEPLSNLDAALRVQMRTELCKLHHRLQTTMIYVTHDQVEAMTMGDRITVMNKAEVLQIDRPMSLYDRPANQFVAGFIGSPAMNFFKGTIVPTEPDLSVHCGGFALKLLPRTCESLKKSGRTAGDVVLGIRPEDIYDRMFVPAAEEGNVVQATVELVEPMGAEIYLRLRCGDPDPSFGRAPRGFLSVTARMRKDISVSVGQDLDLVFDMRRIHLFDAATGQTIQDGI